MKTLVPFEIRVDERALDDLRHRLGETRWPDRETVPDWSQGVPLAYAQELCQYWATDYDWRNCERRLNEYPQYTTRIDEVDIHFLHVRSREADAMPLVVTHGWPGSITEFLDVIDALVDPVAHGGDPADAFDLVVPSLPGFGFSDKPTTTGWGRERIADAWAELMSRLGYDRFAAQGGDWGASVANALGVHHPERLLGIHLNLVSVPPPSGWTPADEAERIWFDEHLAFQAERQAWEMGYVHQQRTRPQTLGYGLADSPAGQCAWVLEKFFAWTDCDGDPIAAFGADRLLDNITTYWVTESATSSARLYWEAQPAAFADVVQVPMGGSIFPEEITRARREWAERAYTDLRYWNEPPRGGHFAAFEQPKLFVQELRACFRTMRPGDG